MAQATPIGLDNSQTRFTDYIAANFGNGVVVGCSILPSTPASAMGSLISFGDGVSVGTQASIINIAQNLATAFGGWAYLPLPDVNGFRHDVFTDPSIPQFPLALIAAIVLSDSSLTYNDRKTLAPIVANWIRNTYPSQGNAIVSALQTYAFNRYIPVT